MATAVTGEGEQNVIKVWNSETCEQVYVFWGHRELIRCLQPNPIYPHVFASVGCDGHVFIWDIHARRRLAEVLDLKNFQKFSETFFQIFEKSKQKCTTHRRWKLGKWFKFMMPSGITLAIC